MQNNDNYIRKYPESDLVRILKDSAYHSEEWEETDSDDEEDEVDILTEESVVKEKTTSIHIYETWWRSPAVCILMVFVFYLFYLLTVIIYLSFDVYYTIGLTQLLKN